MQAMSPLEMVTVQCVQYWVWGHLCKQTASPNQTLRIKVYKDNCIWVPAVLL